MTVKRRCDYINNMAKKTKNIKFYVVENLSDDRSEVFPHICLVHSVWDDWFRYETSYNMYYISRAYSKDYIGSVKIGRKGMTGASKASDSNANLRGSRIPDIEDQFERLGNDFFSLGQGEEYYENIKQKEEESGYDILSALNDLVKDELLLKEVMGEDVFINSLSREVSLMKISNQLRRIVRGGKRVERYEIEYIYKEEVDDYIMEGEAFSMVVDPDAPLPTNLHVIIGRNGVGKTTFLKDLASSLIAPENEDFITERKGEAKITEGDIEGIVCVSFSPFDDLLKEVMTVIDSIEYHHKNPYTFSYVSNSYKSFESSDGNVDWRYKSNEELFLDFLISYLKCHGNNNWDIWKDARAILNQDPIFSLLTLKHPLEPFEDEVVLEETDDISSNWTKIREQLYRLALDIENQISDRRNRGDDSNLTLDSILLDMPLQKKYPLLVAKYQDGSPLELEDYLHNLYNKLFKRLSSGHTAVLVMVTRLIDLLSERTIVLLDEPETHLHPPLLSNLVKVISRTLKKRNSLAIVSTHSPVMLQEVPKSNVYILERDQNITRVSKPSIETFGENVGRLTVEVFKLELLKSGYYATLEDLVRNIVKNHSSNLSRAEIVDKVMEKIDAQVGLEGKMVISSLARRALEGKLDIYDN